VENALKSLSGKALTAFFISATVVIIYLPLDVELILLLGFCQSRERLAHNPRGGKRSVPLGIVQLDVKIIFIFFFLNSVIEPTSQNRKSPNDQLNDRLFGGCNQVPVSVEHQLFMIFSCVQGRL